MNPNPILCVDDDPDVLEFLRIHLGLRPELQGEYFLNPTEALKAVEEGLTPSIALIDIRMPEISGIEFMTRMKELSPKTIRVNMSSHADLDVVLEAIQANNIFGFIRKPISTHDLTGILHKGMKTFQLQEERDELSKNLAEKNALLEEWNQKLDAEVKSKTLELQIRDDLMQHLSGCRPLENPFQVVDRFTQVFLPRGDQHAIYRRSANRYQLVHASESDSFPEELRSDDLGFKGPEPDLDEWSGLLKLETEQIGAIEPLKHHGHPLGVWVITGSSLPATIKTQIQVFTPLVSLLIYDIISLDEASSLAQHNDLFP